MSPGCASTSTADKFSSLNSSWKSSGNVGRRARRLNLTFLSVQCMLYRKGVSADRAEAVVVRTAMEIYLNPTWVRTTTIKVEWRPYFTL